MQPKLFGCDFGVPRKAGDQAKKIILIEAISHGDRRYSILPSQRNERLVRKISNCRWPKNRRGWTLVELAESLAQDESIVVGAFDFPFSIPLSLLNDATFAMKFGKSPFKSRKAWVQFVASKVQLEFSNHLARGTLQGLEQFEPWKATQFWHKRETDEACNACPPMKHKYQNLFNMTVAGVALLNRLQAHGYAIDLLGKATQSRLLFETYPGTIAKQIGFKGSYKTQPRACLRAAIDYLERRNIRLSFHPQVQHFCETYRTSGNDPDGADAFLCLVAAIAHHQSFSEPCGQSVRESILRQEGVIIVPQQLNQ